MDYITALNLLHETLAPKNYVEIGCRVGRSLTLARCPSIAIDPDFEICCDLRSETRLFRQTSDDFFASENLTELLGGSVDVAFVDGMHNAEFALRDILNIEAHGRRDTVIIVDDILPQEMEWTTRERKTQAWTGDVYKVIPFLRKHRPDLDIHVFDIDLKGLAIITNLRPGDVTVQKDLARHELEMAGEGLTYSSIPQLRAALRPEPTETLQGYLNELRDLRSANAPKAQAPKLSVVVVFHDMQREAERTLYSLSAAYQRDVDPQSYEIIAIDNASNIPLAAGFVESFGPQFRLIRHETESSSPVEAVNLGGAAARGEAIAIIVDGARMASPGLISQTIRALALSDVPVVYSPSWHLGPDVQNESILNGYNQDVEDSILRDQNWKEDGYGLFEISTIAHSSSGGILGAVPPEFSWVALPRALFRALEGFDQRFQSPGGGLVNHHFRDRVVSSPGTVPIGLIGEGVFHQIHGGVATNVPMKNHPLRDFAQEYRDITGETYTTSDAPSPLFLGRLPSAARRFL